MKLSYFVWAVHRRRTVVLNQFIAPTVGLFVGVGVGSAGIGKLMSHEFSKFFDLPNCVHMAN